MTKAMSQADVTEVPNPLPPDLMVLDVREQDEWDAGHIADAVHIPLMHVPQRVDDIPADRPILVVCKVGARSAQAAAFLQSHGRDVVNLAGGMHAWDSSGREMVSESDLRPTVA